ncbi:hypothetical protein KGO06_02880 [Patescibacteria group bacterium]|nr:hypothetical protein [Patescibacteria group bacterium]
MPVSAHASDLDYRLWLLEQIRQCRVDSTLLLDITEHGYNVWQRYEQYIFSTDIARFSALGSFDQYRATEGGTHRFVSLKGVIVGAVGVLVTCAATLIYAVRGASVVVYGIDRVSDPLYAADFRMKSVHRFVAEHRIASLEILHTVFNRKFLSNLWARRRPAVYLESFDVLHSIGRFLGTIPPFRATVTAPEGLTVDEDRFARYVIKKYLSQHNASHIRVSALTIILRAVRARAVLAIDDARTFHDLAMAARRAGIPMIAFQHGHFTKYHVGWLQPVAYQGDIPRPNTLVVWSEYWKQELLRLKSIFSADQIQVGTPQTKQYLYPETKNLRMVLIPHETDSPKADIARAIRALVEDGFQVVLKLRPDTARSSQLAQYPDLPHSPAFTVISALEELNDTPGCAVGVYSSFLYEMVSAGIPVGILSDLSPYGVGMIENGLANRVTLETLVPDVQSLIQTLKTELDRRRESLTKGHVPIENVLTDIMHMTHVNG